MNLAWRLLLVMCMVSWVTSPWCQAQGGSEVTQINHEAVSKLHPTAVAMDAKRGKLYIGGLGFNRMTLSVFDLNDRGEPIGRARTYADSLDPVPEGQRSIIKRLHMDPKGRCLYLLLGMAGAVTEAYRPLTTYALDEHGEPAGPPVSVSIGNPNHACDDLAFHPSLPLAYVVGWGGSGVGLLSLDAQGRPTGDATWVETGGGGKMRLALRPDAGKLYMGGYPGQIDIVDLDARGQVNSAVRTIQLPQPRQAYLHLVAFDGALFLDYLDDQSQPLQYLSLDAAGEPMGEARTLDNLIVRDIMPSVDRKRLLAVRQQAFVDALTGELRHGETQVVELALHADGTPQQVTPCGEPLRDTAIHAVNSHPTPVLAISPVRPRFHGNRYAGLEVRLTLEQVESSVPLDAATHTAQFSGHDGYLRFDYSGRFNRIYAASSQAIGSYAPGSELPQFDVVASADLSGPVLVDEQRSRLYAAAIDGRLAVRTLSAQGAIEEAESRIGTGVATITDLALNPATGTIYVMGHGTGAPADDPRIVTVPQVSSNLMGVVSTRHRRLFTATQSPGGPNLWSWRLDDQGRLADTEPTPIADGLPASTPGHPSIAMALALSESQGLLFVGGGAQSAPPPSVGIAVHRLDEQGKPLADPRFFPTANPKNSILALAISGDQRHLYECGWGWPVTSIWNVESNGNLQRSEHRVSHGGMGKSAAAITKDGGHLMIGTNPGVLEITPLDDSGRARPGVAVKFAGQALGMLQVGKPSPWFSLDEPLKDSVGEAVLRGELAAPSLEKAILRAEFRLRGGEAVASHSETYVGPRFAYLAPCYGSAAPDQALNLIQSVPHRYAQYQRMAERVAVSPQDRPSQYVIANGLVSLDDSVGSLTAGLNLLRDLGHNTLEVWHWGHQSPQELQSRLAQAGYDRFRLATYKPPSYFDFVQDQMQPEVLDDWAKQFVRKSEANMGASPRQMTLFHFADEPGWYYPHVLELIKSKPEYLEHFRRDLAQRGLKPADLGAASWSDVAPLGRSQAVDLPSRRLYVWTVRFVVESFSRSMAHATAAAQRQFHSEVPTTINLNNWPGQFHIPSPNKKVGNNPDTGPDAAMGMPDWFDLGRRRAATCFWTEDWFIDQDSPRWSVYADLMRCAARAGGISMGAYVVGRTTGNAPDGASYKVLALAGRGVRTFDFYIFGPAPAFGDGWSEHEGAYGAIADAVRLLGRSESLLYPGRARDGSVAILLPQASQLWDLDAQPHCYLQELFGLHAALVHEQYPVDFVDEIGIAAGELRQRKYQVLYVTGQNLSAAVQKALLAWAKAGGTLVLLPGAGQADEYNDPTRLLDEAMGVTRDMQPRAIWPTPQQLAGMTPIEVSGSDAATFPHMSAVGPFAPLQASPRASVLASAGDRPAVVAMEHGRGRVISYAFWPGHEYWHSADRYRSDQLPRQWSSAARKFVTAPAQLANARRWVHIDQPGVEACLLESDAGVAITLLNWTGQPLDSIRVALPGGERFRTARAARAGAVQFHAGDTSSVTMPLGTVDVLLLER
jgi:hypothetical protein